MSRSVNRKNVKQSTVRYTIYNLVTDIRNKSIEDLSSFLYEKSLELYEDLKGVEYLILHQQNKKFIKFLLIRMTTYIENRSKINSNYPEYENNVIGRPYEIEHIWANVFEEHEDEFSQRDEFFYFRSTIGDLVLVQNGINQSFGALPYEDKISDYYGQKSLLTKSLNKQCYQNNPSFKKFLLESKLPFQPKDQFKKEDIKDRSILYKQILEQIYDINYFKSFTNTE